MTTIATLSPLSSPEERKLAQYEDQIEKGLQSFVDVGRSLMWIRDNKLYRSTDETFEKYCRRRWKFSTSRASQLIGCVEAIENVESLPVVKPTNERQARALASIDTPEHQADVWSKAVETAPKDADGKPRVTAAHVRKVANQLAGKAPEPEDDPDDPTDISEPARPAEPNELGELRDEIRAAYGRWTDGKPPHVKVFVDETLKELMDA